MEKQSIKEVVIDILILLVFTFTGIFVITDTLIKILLVTSGIVAIIYSVLDLIRMIKNN